MCCVYGYNLALGSEMKRCAEEQQGKNRCTNAVSLGRIENAAEVVAVRVWQAAKLLMNAQGGSLPAYSLDTTTALPSPLSICVCSLYISQSHSVSASVQIRASRLSPANPLSFFPNQPESLGWAFMLTECGG